MKSTLKIIRVAQNERSTLSHLYINGLFACYLLEDSTRKKKIATQTAIPEGKYKFIVNTSGSMHRKYSGLYSWHKGMLEIAGIPNYNGVFIHIGNTIQHTSGCPLTGLYWQKTGTGDYIVLQSKVAYELIYEQLYDIAVKGNAIIEVKNLQNIKYN